MTVVLSWWLFGLLVTHTQSHTHWYWRQFLRANILQRFVNKTYIPSCIHFYICHFGVSLVAQMVKNQPEIWETWVWSLGWEDPLEEGMATPSNILAWRISWTEEPGRLQSMGSHRVRRDWSDLACTCHSEAHLKATEKQKQKQNCYLWGNTIQVSTNTALSEAKLPSQIMVLIHQIFTEWLLCVKYYARDCGTCSDKCVCLLWSDFAALTERVAMVAP